jgi:rhodanese-related sulfurtransferase
VAEGTATGTELSPGRGAELIGAGAEIIDVRRHYEWEAGRIAGARLIEMNDLREAAESIPKDRPVIFYCRSGNRSAMAAAAFREAGWDAHSLEGGLEAWAGAGHELDPPEGEVAGPRPGF